VRLAWRNFGFFVAILSIAVLAYLGSKSIWHGAIAFILGYFLLSKLGDRPFLVFVTEHAAKDNELLSYLYENQLAGFRSKFGRTYDLESRSTWQEALNDCLENRDDGVSVEERSTELMDEIKSQLKR
jgi:hypothetical protein